MDQVHPIQESKALIGFVGIMLALAGAYMLILTLAFAA